ncbi:MAG: hypothetical protein N4A63_04860 [Vallitalea sp.]|jgi:hypothetical protein|nr:hypothetical protein [Vallitalea sp.]
MSHDEYTIKSYLTNLSTYESVSYKSLTKKQRNCVEKNIIEQMLSVIGYEIKSIKTETELDDKR